MLEASLQDTLSEASSRLRALHGLRRLIRDGRLGSQDPLPSERKLSAQLGVGRTVVRRVLDQLQTEGLISRDDGGKAVVTTGSPSDHSWLSKAIVFLDPLASSRQMSSTQAYWANYISLGLAGAIRDAGHHVVALNPKDLNQRDTDRLVQDRPIGLVVPEVSTAGDQTLHLVRRLVTAKVPVVVYGGDPQLADYDRVMSDHEAGAYQLTRWLIDQGRRRIAHVWPAPADGYWFSARQVGYERAMREAGLDVRPAILCCPLPLIEAEANEERQKVAFDAAVRHMAGYLVEPMIATEPLDALMTGTDRDAFAVAAACRVFGKTPGKDVLITGYDNYWERCCERAFEPNPLAATVDKYNDRMGQEMVSLLLDRSTGRIPEAPQCRRIEPRVVSINNNQRLTTSNEQPAAIN